MSANLSRSFKTELASFLDKNVIVTTNDGKEISGILLGMKEDDLSLILSDCEIDNVKKHRLFISGSSISLITLGETPFDIFGLREELEKVFKKDGVRYYKETRTLMILDRYKVSEKGVEGPAGAVLDRISRIWSGFNSQSSD
ncbi:MAG: Lsm family RNA-binding protein [Candidatus Heimdallarchaeota archaeon]|nr:Lsm family RNA-binding protein [Candidatus Heimdallarchaeota archaeon]